MQQDFIAIDLALSGSAAMLFWLGAVGFSTTGGRVGRLALAWVGWYGLLAGVDAWIGLRALGVEGAAMHGTMWSLPQLLASVCLVEFWARSRGRAGLPRRAAWAYFTLLAMYASSMALWPGDPLRWASALFAALAGCLGAWAFLFEAGRSGEHRPSLWACAAGMAVLGVVTSIQSFSGALSSVAVTSGEAGGGAALVVHAGVAGILAALIWRLGGFTRKNVVLRMVEVAWLPVLLAVVLLTGWLGAVGAGIEDENRRRNSLLSHAGMIAAALDRDEVGALKFGGEDTTRRGYLALKGTLSAIARSDKSLASVVLYEPRADGGVVGVVSSEPGSAGYLPPGSVYAASAGTTDAVELLRNATPYVDGPVRVGGGLRLTVHVPVLRHKTGGVRSALAMEVRVGQWARLVNEARSVPLRVSMLVAVVLLGVFVAARLHRRFELRMQAGERRYRSMFQCMQEGMAYCRLIKDGSGRSVDFEFLDMNPAAEKLTGFRREDVIGRTLRGIFPGDTDRLLKWIDYFGTVAATGRTRSREMHFAPRGRWFLVRGFSWERGRFAISLADITERRLTELEHRRLALHDPLTELPNRRLFRDRLDQAIAVADRNKTRCAVLYMDLNDFKAVNDNHGHALGDLVLAEVAKRLKACMRKSDTLARIGGDEFVAVVPEINGAGEIAAVSAKIQTAMARPFQFGEIQVRLGVSIGVAVYPEHGADAQDVLVRADAAMYQGKGDKSRQFVLYDG